MSNIDKFYKDTLKGFSDEGAWIPLSHAFDSTGSEIFVRCTQNPLYYITKAEKLLLKDNVKNICDTVLGPNCLFIELGSGLCEKSIPFLEHLKDPVAFVGLDIDQNILKQAQESTLKKFEHIKFIPLVCDFFEDFNSEIKKIHNEKRRIFYMSGNNIGFFSDEGLFFYNIINS